MNTISNKQGLRALSPLGIFIVIYLVLSIVAGDFYKVPITVAFLLSSIWAIATLPGKKSFDEKIETFSAGASDRNLLLMIWIFLLAGAFASTTGAMGSKDATVQMVLSLLPGNMILAGMFLASCIVSLSIGTSVGTIAALVPIACGIHEETGLSLLMLVGGVVGGAFFGDNLSFISDTTIMATRTQGCRLADKFRVNVRIVTPAALLILVLYVIIGIHTQVDYQPRSYDMLLVLPYLLAFVLACAGMNVLKVLFVCTLTAGIIGLCKHSFPDSIYGLFDSMSAGMLGMSELIIVTLLAAGMVGVMRNNGGVDYLLQKLTTRVKSKRGAKFSIAALVTAVDVCTANNTIAILTSGTLAREISNKYGIDPRQSASILDTFSCFAQSIIPYGAQLLIAAGLAQINPVEIIPFLFYPAVMCLFALGNIAFKKD